MRYLDGKEVKLGDKVSLGEKRRGEVVCSVDTEEFTTEYPADQWSYLKSGVLIKFDDFGLIHYVEPKEDLRLVSRD